MKNTNEPVEQLDFLPPQPERKITKTVLMIMAALVLVTLSAMQVAAFARDTVLEALEANHLSAVTTYTKFYEATLKSLDATNQSAEAVCSSYNALKAYKEVKGYTIQDPLYNPCQSIRGFEGFQLPEQSQPIAQE
jgi:hypothetical protein